MSKYDLRIGDCLEVLKSFPDNHFDSIITDPPYGISFMGKRWDHGVPSAEIWAECLRVLKPEGSLLSFAGTRTQHRMVANIVEGGFKHQDVFAWVYGCLSEDSEVLTKYGWSNWLSASDGKEIYIYDNVTGDYRWEIPQKWSIYNVYEDTAYSIRSGATDQIVSRGHRCLVDMGNGLEFKVAEELPNVVNVPVLTDFDGLNPMHTMSEATVTPVEYAGVFWCPTVSTGAFVARRNGKVFLTGNSGFPKSLNISKAIDSRRATNDVIRPWLKSLGSVEEIASAAKVTTRQVDHWLGENTPCPQTLTEERFILLCQHFGVVPEWADKMYKKVGEKLGEVVHSRSGGEDFAKIPGSKSEKRVEDVTSTCTDLAKEWEGWGTALKPAWEPISWFGKGVDAPELYDGVQRFLYCAKAAKKERGEGNTHPTLKPLKLMSWLCNMATPSGGLILDPFMGSGSTGIAALQNGFDFVGVDLSEEYVGIAKRRISSFCPDSVDISGNNEGSAND